MEGTERLGPAGDLRIASVGSQLGMSRLGYRSLLSVVGVASADIETVTISRGDRSFPTELQTVPAELARSLGFERPFKVYAAFDTRPLRGRGPIEVRGFDADGRLAVRRRQEGSAMFSSTGPLHYSCRRQGAAPPPESSPRRTRARPVARRA